MASINRKLKHWLDASLINTEQYQAIQRYEAEHHPPRKLWVSIMLLGVSVMGLGVISLIAANWAFIPLLIKLGLAFTLLTILGISIWIFDQRQQPIAFEASLTGFLIGCLAMIGLLSQLFHSGGQWYHALLLWGVMTLPLVLLARHQPARFIWTSLALTGLVWTIVAIPHADVWDAILTPIIPLQGFFIAVLVYYATIYLKWLNVLSKSTLFWMQLSGLMALFYIDAFRLLGSWETINFNEYLIACIFAALIAIGIVFNRTYSLLNRVLLLACLVLLLLYYHPTWLFSGKVYYSWNDSTNISLWQWDNFIAPALTLLILTLYTIHIGNQGLMTSFNIITLLIGLRFMVLYFEALGGLAVTGIGLIISGAFLMGIAWLWQHYRTRLQQWTQGLDQ